MEDGLVKPLVHSTVTLMRAAQKGEVFKSSVLLQTNYFSIQKEAEGRATTFLKMKSKLQRDNVTGRRGMSQMCHSSGQLHSLTFEP